jgi:hypothetical protein
LLLLSAKSSVENNLGYNIENTPNYQNTAINAAMGLHDDGKTGGTLNSWGQYAKSGNQSSVHKNYKSCHLVLEWFLF